jgi:hypothetical protein
MARTSRQARHQQLIQYVNTYDANRWAGSITSAVVQAAEKAREYAHLDRLDISHLISAYERSQRRLLMLDYDGTLVPFQSLPQLAAPPQNVVNCIEQLSQELGSTIYVVSSRGKEFLEEWFGHLPGVGLVAENGYWIRAPQRTLGTTPRARVIVDQIPRVRDIPQRDASGSIASSDFIVSDIDARLMAEATARPSTVAPGPQLANATQVAAVAHAPQFRKSTQQLLEELSEREAMQERARPRMRADGFTGGADCYTGGSYADWKAAKKRAMGARGRTLRRRLSKQGDAKRSGGTGGDSEARDDDGRNAEGQLGGQEGGQEGKQWRKQGGHEKAEAKGSLFNHGVGTEAGTSGTEARAAEYEDYENDGDTEDEDEDEDDDDDDDDDDGEDEDRHPFQRRRPQPWRILCPSAEPDWHEPVTHMLEHYTERTPGSFFESEENILTWHFADADPDFGMNQVR